ncbi:hypothetical protein NGRA_0020 [Nosema granulosis]|uniref:Uncharacterized protein n=1 Tax=Nosema granulosis TaxID=83296 RepID=A0A9P6H142_9MICR|nr:hypothetical protein NGRA_0020 [Nosema granulosis]
MWFYFLLFNLLSGTYINSDYFHCGHLFVDVFSKDDLLRALDIDNIADAKLELYRYNLQDQLESYLGRIEFNKEEYDIYEKDMKGLMTMKFIIRDEDKKSLFIKDTDVLKDSYFFARFIFYPTDTSPFRNNRYDPVYMGGFLYFDRMEYNRMVFYHDKRGPEVGRWMMKRARRFFETLSKQDKKTVLKKIPRKAHENSLKVDPYKFVEQILEEYEKTKKLNPENKLGDSVYNNNLKYIERKIIIENFKKFVEETDLFGREIKSDAEIKNNIFKIFGSLMVDCSEISLSTFVEPLNAILDVRESSKGGVEIDADDYVTIMNGLAYLGDFVGFTNTDDRDPMLLNIPIYNVRRNHIGEVYAYKCVYVDEAASKIGFGSFLYKYYSDDEKLLYSDCKDPCGKFGYSVIYNEKYNGKIVSVEKH